MAQYKFNQHLPLWKQPTGWIGAIAEISQLGTSEVSPQLHTEGRMSFLILEMDREEISHFYVQGKDVCQRDPKSIYIFRRFVSPLALCVAFEEMYEETERLQTGICILPELHDTCDIARRIDAADVVEIANIQTPIDAPCQRHRRQQLVALGLPITARAWDASPPPVPHNGGNHTGLKRDELVLSAAFVQNAWEKRGGNYVKAVFVFFFCFFFNQRTLSADMELTRNIPVIHLLSYWESRWEGCYTSFIRKTFIMLFHSWQENKMEIHLFINGKCDKQKTDWLEKSMTDGGHLRCNKCLHRHRRFTIFTGRLQDNSSIIRVTE